MIYWRGNPADTVLPCKLSEGVTGALHPEATLTTPHIMACCVWTHQWHGAVMFLCGYG